MVFNPKKHLAPNLNHAKVEEPRFKDRLQHSQLQKNIKYGKNAQSKARVEQPWPMDLIQA